MPATPTALRTYALSVAGPRDVIINVLINGTIAWSLYGAAERVAVTGDASMFSMLLPMTVIEGTLTTFFGVLSGFDFLRRTSLPPGDRNISFWLKRAIARGLACGLTGGALVFGAMLLLQARIPQATVSAAVTIGLITGWSGLLAFVLHSRAVMSVAGRHAMKAAP